MIRAKQKILKKELTSKPRSQPVIVAIQKTIQDSGEDSNIIGAVIRNIWGVLGRESKAVEENERNNNSS